MPPIRGTSESPANRSLDTDEDRRDLAPIVIFTFRRPLETLQTLWSLSRCPEARNSEIYIYCDGPRKDSDRTGVNQTRKLVREQCWFPKATVIEHEENWGLARSVVHGVSNACERYGRAIVVEDDLVVSSGFLRYMNEALERYRDDSRVMQISGHSFPLDDTDLRRTPGVARLLPAGTTWGWATWARAWMHYQTEVANLDLLQDARVARSFDLDGTYGYTDMLRATTSGRVDSWGIRWWWSMFQRWGLGLFPFPSLVKNAGSTAGATNTIGVSPFLDVLFDLDAEVAEFPTSRLADEQVFSLWKNYLRKIGKPSLWHRLEPRQVLRKAASRLTSR